MADLTIDEIKKLPPEERIKFLKKIEDERKKEIEEAEQSLKKIEQEKKREIEEAEKIIKRSELEIKSRKEEEEEEEQKDKDKREIRSLAVKEENLEGIVEKTPGKEGEEKKGPVYGAPLEELKQIYQVATRDIYEGIKSLRNTASERKLTSDEEARLNSYDSAFSRINNVQAAYIRDEQTRITVLKAKEALEQMKKYESGNY